MPVEIPLDKWPGAVQICTIGATASEGGTRTSKITVGGQKTMPFLHFESPTPYRPVIAVQIRDYYPAGILTYRHILHLLAAKTPEDLSDKGFSAARQSPLETFIQKRDAARLKAQSGRK